MFFLYFTKSGIIFDDRDLILFWLLQDWLRLIEDNYQKIDLFSDISSFENDIEINDDYKSFLKLKKEIKSDERNFQANV